MRPLGIILNTLARRPPMSFRPSGTGWHGWHAAGSAREKGGRAPRRARGPGAIDIYPPEPEPEPDPGGRGWLVAPPSVLLPGTLARLAMGGRPISKGGRRSAALPGAASLAGGVFNFQRGVYTHPHTRARLHLKKEREIYNEG